MPTGIAVRYDNPFPVIGEFDDHEEIRKVVDSATELMPYPPQPNIPKLFVFVGEVEVPAEFLHNRWRTVGNFCVVKTSSTGRFLSGTDEEAEAVVFDLRGSKGYLDPECPTPTVFREPSAR